VAPLSCTGDVTVSTTITPSRDGLRVTSARNDQKSIVSRSCFSTSTIMAPLKVHIKHAGKKHDVELDPVKPPLAFKEAVYQVTGVPVDRMKVMVKGGVLKDDSDWEKIGPKEGQTFMVVGAAGELPKPPAEPIKFLEDMNDTELADVVGSMPVVPLSVLNRL